MFGVPYTGSKRFSSAFSIHKGHTKNLLKRQGIKSPVHKVFNKNDPNFPTIQELWCMVPNPSVVKPIAAGLSVGVSVSRSVSELRVAVEKAFTISDAIIVEEYISGREAACGVLDNFRDQKVYALLPVERTPPKGARYIDHEAKQGGNSKVVYPGRFSAAEKESMQNIARVVHVSLGLRQYSCSDFIVTPRRGIYFLEVNTLPELYSNTPYTEALNAIGLPLSDFLDHVLALALEN